jgi:hypothetical protein
MIKVELTGETAAEVVQDAARLFKIEGGADTVFMDKVTAEMAEHVAARRAAEAALEAVTKVNTALVEENNFLRNTRDNLTAAAIQKEAVLAGLVPPSGEPDAGPATMRDIPADDAPPAKAKPVKAETPSPAREALSSTELRGLLGDLRDKCGKDALTAVLSKFGVVQFSKIEPKDYLAVEDEARALLAGNT